jgi:excinuclease ABC subunit C
MQGTDTVASMVVWESGRMKKSDYRKFIIHGMTASNDGTESPAPDSGETTAGSDVASGMLPDANAAPDNGLLRDDFASMREVVTRRYRRLAENNKPLPSLILIDGGIGQLHAAAQALESLEIINQPVASIAKQEEILYVLGREGEPIVLEKHSPILHLIQQIRDETHRFAITFHRQRRTGRQLRTELLEIPGIGERTAVKLLRHFGSVARLRGKSAEELARVLTKPQARRVYEYFHGSGATAVISDTAERLPASK